MIDTVILTTDSDYYRYLKRAERSNASRSALSMMIKTFAFVLAGGCGSRLLSLTAHQAKPALDFAGGTRIIDFVLSNLVNSGIARIVVPAQYKPQSLVDHVHSHWEPVLRR